MKRIKIEDTNAKANALAIHFPQIVMANGFWQPKVQDSPKVFVAPHHHFWKTLWRFLKKGMNLIYLPFLLQATFQTFLTMELNGLHQHVFLNIMLFQLFYNKIVDPSLILYRVKGKHKIGISQYTTHDLRCIKYHFCIIIHTKKMTNR
jgi:hypothetical protein